MTTTPPEKNEQTMVSPPIQTGGQRRRPWTWIAAVGCGVLLCLATLIGGGIAGYYYLQDRESPLSVAADATLAAETPPVAVTVEIEPPTVEATPEPASPTPTPEEATVEPTDTPTDTPEPEDTPTPRSLRPPSAEATPTPQPAGPPSIGQIVFASEAPESNTIPAPTTSFPTDTFEIHAIFEYSGLSPANEWTRIWYLDGEEFATFSDRWNSDEAGTFDYSISTESTGEPLAAGEWTLEMYVDGELLSSGQFTIEAPQPVASRNYRLAYTVWDGGKHLLFLANIDGSGRQFVLERATGPSWSDSGRGLYVYGEEGVDRQVRDGTEYTWPDAGVSNGILWIDLTTLSGGIPDVFQDPGWKDGTVRATALAPNGAMLAYDAAHGGPDRRIYFLGTADNQQFRIEIPGEQPSWSPDSNQVTYRSCRDNKCGIWVSNRDDSGARNITNNGGDAFPDWSPNGRQIVFSRDTGGNHDIFVMNTDGSNVRQLTNSPAHDTLPVWTPDGQRIVFRSARSGSWGIYVMNADGSGQTQIIPDTPLGPDWSFSKMDVY